MPQWIYVAGTLIFLIACVIWALMLFGAWVHSLDSPRAGLRRFALREQYAAPIMKAMVREVIVLVLAIAAILGAFYQQTSVREKAETVTAGLLTQVRGESTPTSVAESLIAMSSLPTKLERTVHAYVLYIRQANDGRPPHIHLIEATLPKNRNAFDMRLVGLAYDRLAERMSQPNRDDQLRYLEIAARSYQAALHPNAELPGINDRTTLTEFQDRVKSNLAGVTLSMAKLYPAGGAERRKLLESAAREYRELKSTSGRIATYLNLAGAYSLLGEYEADNFRLALEVLNEAAQAPSLTASDKSVAKSLSKDLKKMSELGPLASYEEARKNTNWGSIIDEIFASKP